MSLYSKIDKYILIPIADKLTKRGLSREWRLMDRLDMASEEELREVQNQRLQALVQHCYQNVPYYTKLFNRLGLKPEDIQCREDLQKLPVLTKQMVRDNYDDLISLDAAKRHYQKASTGGSTGTPVKFMKDTPTWNMQWTLTHGLTQCVTFVGQVPNTEMPNYLSQSDIMLSAPHIDNMPVSVLEAMNAGVLVISSRVGGVPYIMDENRTGLFFADDNSNELAEKMIWAIEHPNEVQQMIDAAQVEVQKYKWENIKEQIYSIYEYKK